MNTKKVLQFIEERLETLYGQERIDQENGGGSDGALQVNISDLETIQELIIDPALVRADAKEYAIEYLQYYVEKGRKVDFVKIIREHYRDSVGKYHLSLKDAVEIYEEVREIIG